MHKFLIRSFVSSLVLLFTLTVAAVAKDVKAAFVYIGPTGDHGLQLDQYKQMLL